jgi:hypothetical protein
MEKEHRAVRTTRGGIDAVAARPERAALLRGARRAAGPEEDQGDHSTQHLGLLVVAVARWWRDEPEDLLLASWSN